jgi:hypothetical protein
MAVRRIIVLLGSLVLSLSIIGAASAQSEAPRAGAVGNSMASTAQEAPDAEDAAVLPSRVTAAIRRTENALANAEEHVDEAEYAKAIISLRAVRVNLGRADKAARRQMNAVPADPEAETTPGPDAVIAVLSLDQEAVVRVAGLFNGNSGTLVSALASTISTAQLTRDRLLNGIIALDPEGAGADYSDGMADTLDGYTDEVANLKDALADDKLTAGGTAALRAALTRANAILAKINTAYGGGE